MTALRQFRGPRASAVNRLCPQSARGMFTAAAHAGGTDSVTGSVVTPIYQTSTFWFRNSKEVTDYQEGKTDRETEKLNFRWVTKPRKGIGVSASMITNPYIKLGGTLSNPSIELKPLEALTSTGVAIATMGISLVAKGMLDRVTAEKKVCTRALQEIEELKRDAAEAGDKK